MPAAPRLSGAFRPDARPDLQHDAYAEFDTRGAFTTITRFHLVSVSIAAALLVAVAAGAHRSFAMFDRNTEIVKSAARWAFNNPHSWLYLNVRNPDET